ncbi:lantibiotic dehydratase family protein [Dysgonomonas sp. ZJ279]|uniref:lantibiotic dehydratase family protein n=1 Tax=Dysgonomonas sp. ZJ279 TaxID=2709796 RepID=UPI0013EC99B7|nr:lantibiotic dehydratase family protein [Dysgonomonas sp. ZJ279]
MYKAFNNFILRTPLFPFNLLGNNQNISDQISSSNFKESIYIGSPVLYKELSKYLQDQSTYKNDRKHLFSGLYRYISRMSTRSTPFGLFAGCTVGVIAEETDIILEDSINRKTRLDMYYLCTLYDILVKKPGIKEKIAYYPNTSLYPVNKKYRYVEWQYIESRKKYHITEIEQTSYLKKILKIASKGADINILVNSLINNEISEKEAIGFINELIDSQIIVAELSQSVTGDDFFSCIIKLLERIDYQDPLLPKLKDIQNMLITLDLNKHDVDLYEKIIMKIVEIGVPYEENFLFQVDMIRNASVVNLGFEIIDELKSVMCFLNKITPSGKNELLNQFQEDFYNRYESREVPLMEVLDTEMGIGYPSKKNNGDISPLVDDLYLPHNIEQNGGSLTPIQSVLLKKTIKCLSQNEEEIILTDEDVENINISWSDLPSTLYTMFEIIRTKPSGPLIRLVSCGGSSGANLLARFAHTDSEIAELVQNITSKEQELMPDIVLAEIVHLPEARTGNILSRPHLRKYELLYISHSDLPHDRILYLSDLTLSIKQGRLMIRSKKLNKEILPRLTTAHNYHNSNMPVYRFLCDMQNQTGRNSLYFSWGQLEKELQFRPRVKYKNTILSLATWVVRVREIEHLFVIKEDEKIISEISIWRKIRSLPQYVLMPDGDNKLLVDWENPLSIHALFSLIKKREIVIFTEFLFEKENAIVKNQNGVYLNECIVAFYKK